VGLVVGPKVGSVVGSSVGLNVGLLVAPSVGRMVGATVGLNEGTDVEANVDSVVGAAVGTGSRRAVGLLVGPGVSKGGVDFSVVISSFKDRFLLKNRSLRATPLGVVDTDTILLPSRFASRCS